MPVCWRVNDSLLQFVSFHLFDKYIVHVLLDVMPLALIVMTVLYFFYIYCSYFAMRASSATLHRSSSHALIDKGISSCLTVGSRISYRILLKISCYEGS
jgi:hypothetical protein